MQTKKMQSALIVLLLLPMSTKNVFFNRYEQMILCGKISSSCNGDSACKTRRAVFLDTRKLSKPTHFAFIFTAMHWFSPVETQKLRIKQSNWTNTCNLFNEVWRAQVFDIFCQLFDNFLSEFWNMHMLFSPRTWVSACAKTRNTATPRTTHEHQK